MIYIVQLKKETTIYIHAAIWNMHSFVIDTCNSAERRDSGCWVSPAPTAASSGAICCLSFGASRCISWCLPLPLLAPLKRDLKRARTWSNTFGLGPLCGWALVLIFLNLIIRPAYKKNQIPGLWFFFLKLADSPFKGRDRFPGGFGGFADRSKGVDGWLLNAGGAKTIGRASGGGAIAGRLLGEGGG